MLQNFQDFHEAGKIKVSSWLFGKLDKAEIESKERLIKMNSSLIPVPVVDWSAPSIGPYLCIRLVSPVSLHPRDSSFAPER